MSVYECRFDVEWRVVVVADHSCVYYIIQLWPLGRESWELQNVGYLFFGIGSWTLLGNIALHK